VTMPNGSSGVNPDLTYGITADGSIPGLVDRDQATVTAALKANVQSSPGWNGASSSVWSGMTAGLPLPMAILKAIADALGLSGVWTTLTHVQSAIGSWWNTTSTFIGGTVDALVTGFLGFVGSGFSTADAQKAAADTAASVASMAAAVAALQAKASNGSYSGNASIVDFSIYSDSSSLGSPPWSQTYSGSGSGVLGITGGRASWQPVNGDSRTCVVRYNNDTSAAVSTKIQSASPAYYRTLTDYQEVGAVYATAPQSSLIGGINAYNYLYARMNSAGTSYVYAKLGYTTCELGTVVAGTKTVFATASSFRFKAGSSYYLVAGTTGGSRIFQITENSVPKLTYTDASSVSQMSSSYRYTGFGAYSYTNLLGTTGPGRVAAFSFLDNTPQPTLGSGFRRYRASTSTVSQGSGVNLISNGFFDTLDLMTADYAYDNSANNNKLTVSISGWYAVTIRMAVSPYIAYGNAVSALLYKNGTSVQASPESFGTSTGSGSNFGGTFLIYCTSGDYLQPGVLANNSLNLIGGSSGNQTYWEVVFLNNQVPTNN